MTMMIEIQQEMVDDIIKQELTASYDYMVSENKAIKELKSIPPYKKEDFEYNKKMIKHLRKVLHYYMTPEEKEAFDAR